MSGASGSGIALARLRVMDLDLGAWLTVYESTGSIRSGWTRYGWCGVVGGYAGLVDVDPSAQHWIRERGRARQHVNMQCVLAGLLRVAYVEITLEPWLRIAM